MREDGVSYSPLMAPIVGSVRSPPEPGCAPRYLEVLESLQCELICCHFHFLLFQTVLICSHLYGSIYGTASSCISKD